MASILISQGVVFATAMAVSGTVILLALRLQKSLPPLDHKQVPRSCISSGGKKKEKKKKKKVHFAEDVVDRPRDGEEFRRQLKALSLNSSTKGGGGGSGGDCRYRGMPANRVALYNGILRDRWVQRLTYSC